MVKNNKNDLCPCGSGKKHKNCCDQNNLIIFSDDPYNEELTNLMYQLYEFAMENYPNQLQEIYAKYRDEYSLDDFDETDLELIAEYMVAWAIFNQPISQGWTIYDYFYRLQNKRLNYTRTKRVFKTWKNIKGSIYSVTGFNENDHTYTVHDIVTKQDYIYYLPEEQNIELDYYLIGIAIPLINNKIEFYPGLIQLQLSDIDDVIMLLEQLNLSIEEINDHFIEIIISILGHTDPFITDWEHPIYKEVAIILFNEMNRENYRDSLVEKGVAFWKMYCEMELPTIKNPNIYAATLEYFILNNLTDDKRKTQKIVAQKYNVSPQSISPIYQRFSHASRQIMEANISHEDPIDQLEDSFNDPLADLEKQLSSLHRAMEDEEFESSEAMETFIENFMTQENSFSQLTSSRDKAEELLFEAVQTSGDEQRKLIEQSLRIYPNNPDAYLLLASQIDDVHLRENVLAKALKVGQEELGYDVFENSKGDFWSMIDTRPYMRALMANAEHCLLMDDIQGARDFFEEMLLLNKNDNQGARYKLLPIYLEMGAYEAAEQLFSQYADEPSAVFLFNRPLLTYLQDGPENIVQAQLNQAIDRNAYVLKYLLGHKDLPKEQPEYFSFGGESEAIIYVQENIHLWDYAQPLLDQMTNK